MGLEQFSKSKTTIKKEIVIASIEKPFEEKETEIYKPSAFQKFQEKFQDLPNLEQKILYYIYADSFPFPLSCWSIGNHFKLPESQIMSICESFTERKLIIKVFFNGHDAYEKPKE